MSAPVWSFADVDWPLAIAVGVACGLVGLALIYAGVSTVRQLEDDVPGVAESLVRSLVGRFRPDGPAWACAACRSVNPGAAGHCYRCRLSRGAEPTRTAAEIYAPSAEEAMVPVFDDSVLDPLVPVMASPADRVTIPRRSRRPAGPANVRHLSTSRQRRPSRLTPPSHGA